MTKALSILPEKVRLKGSITFRDIPINSYDRPVQEERGNFSDADLRRIYRDMAIIREFENMLFQIKTTDAYNGVSYVYPGPAHLSIGQEASAVGEAFLLDKDDFIFGSHRSHGEILAKGLSAIAKLPEDDLWDIMRTFAGGAVLKVVEREFGGSDLRELGIDFLLYGTLAEIFGRENGFQKGLGGSMHAFFTPFGIYPNNAIVGGAAGIAMGAALFKKVNKRPGMVIANVGDGSLGCGPVWEAMNMAGMDQYRLLWEEGYRGGLPIIFNFMNNQYGMGGQTSGETMGFGMLARVGAGLSPEQMQAERIDGYNPLAVIDAIRRKKELIASGKGPVLLDTLTYRYAGHSPSDSSSYRTKEEIEAWMGQDSIESYKRELIAAGVAGEDDCRATIEETQRRMTEIVRLASDENVSPRMNLEADPGAIAKVMFSGEKFEALAPGKPDVLLPKEENPRLLQLKGRSRSGLENGKPLSKNKVVQLRDAIFEAVLDRFYADPTLIAYGEDNRDWGGAFAVYRGLTEALPYHRFFNAPISEAAIVASAVGYAMAGGRALVELMYADFIGRAGDEIFNQLAKWQGMSAGTLRMPVVLRVSIGSKYGAQHSQDWTALVQHIPGLKVVYPATPYDAKGLMNSALVGTDPVVFFESQRIYDKGELFHAEGVPEGYYEVPIGEPEVKRTGGDVTILSMGAALYQAVEAADILEEKYGVGAEIIDARSITPFNYEPVLASVRKTGRIVLVSEACERGAAVKDMAHNITDLAFDSLDAPPVVVGARNWITPAYEFDRYFFPQPEWIVDAIHERLLPLPGHQSAGGFGEGGRIRRERLGV